MIITYGALFGANVKAASRYGDLENRISTGTASAYVAKRVFKEHEPYSKQYTVDGVMSLYINLHFLGEVRRQLSGVSTAESSDFSPEEQVLWNDYTEYNDGIIKEGEVLLAVDTLDAWLVRELTGTEQPVLDRTYASTHKWNKV